MMTIVHINYHILFTTNTTSNQKFILTRPDDFFRPKRLFLQPRQIMKLHPKSLILVGGHKFSLLFETDCKMSKDYHCPAHLGDLFQSYQLFVLKSPSIAKISMQSDSNGCNYPAFKLDDTIAVFRLQHLMCN